MLFEFKCYFPIDSKRPLASHVFLQVVKRALAYPELSGFRGWKGQNPLSKLLWIWSLQNRSWRFQVQSIRFADREPSGLMNLQADQSIPLHTIRKTLRDIIWFCPSNRISSLSYYLAWLDLILPKSVRENITNRWILLVSCAVEVHDFTCIVIRMVPR